MVDPAEELFDTFAEAAKDGRPDAYLTGLLLLFTAWVVRLFFLALCAGVASVAWQAGAYLWAVSP